MAAVVERVEGTACVLRGDDIDTDRIIPARFLKTVVFDGLGEHAFEDDCAQLRERGEVHPFDDPRHAGARILLVNKNFGCGSSREHAPQALVRWGGGIAALVGESFAEIFFGNCTVLGVPCLTVDAASAEALQSAVEADPTVEVRVDLEARSVVVGDRRFEARIADGPRKQLLEGRWDSTAELLGARDRILATAARLAYLRGYAP